MGSALRSCPGRASLAAFDLDNQTTSAQQTALGPPSCFAIGPAGVSLAKATWLRAIATARIALNSVLSDNRQHDPPPPPKPVIMHAPHLLATALAVAACSTPPWRTIEVDPDHSAQAGLIELPRHVIEVDPRGRGNPINEPLIQQLAAEELERPLSENELTERGCPGVVEQDDEGVRLRQHFVCILEHALDRQKKWIEARQGEPAPVLKLVFYFNGGLNGREDVLRTALGSYEQMDNEGVFPIYMVWPTGAWGTYWEDVGNIRSGRRTKWSDLGTAPTIPVRPLLDFVRGLAATPQALGTSFVEFQKSHLGLGSEQYTVERDNALFVRDNLIDPDHNLYYTEHVDEVDRAGKPIARASNYFRFAVLSPFRTISTPLIGPGEAGWRNMVRRTRTSVRAVEEFPGEFDAADTDLEAQDCANDLQGNGAKMRRCYPRGAGGFARFFQWLQSCATGEALTKNADGCPLDEPKKAEAKDLLVNMRITMIGHSMGAIVINELVQLFPDLPYENLVYMAGAASVRDTARAVTPILRENRGCTKFYNLMLHPMNDAREPTAEGFLLSGSLLVYVDEFLETPKTLPDRTVGQWRNIKMTRHLFPSPARKWMLFHVFDREAQPIMDQLDWNPTRHGEFNDPNMPFWREDFWKPPQVQFPRPDVESCENLFFSRLTPKAEEASADSWGQLLKRAEAGETIRITGADGRTVGRLVPPTPEEAGARTEGR